MQPWVLYNLEILFLQGKTIRPVTHYMLFYGLSGFRVFTFWHHFSLLTLVVKKYFRYLQDLENQSLHNLFWKSLLCPPPAPPAGEEMESGKYG